MVEFVRNILATFSINPVYFAALIGIGFSLSYLTDIKNWEKVPSRHKHIIIPTIIGTIMMIIFSFLEFFFK